MLADLPRYLSVLLLLRASCETSAAVLVTAAFVHWLGDGWRAFLAAAGVMIVLHYVLTGVRPAARPVGPHTERSADAPPASCYPLTRALGPLPRLLVAVGNALPPAGPACRRQRASDGRRPGGGPSCAAWSTSSSAGTASSRASAR